jgi:hippurate hydrolase
MPAPLATTRRIALLFALLLSLAPAWTAGAQIGERPPRVVVDARPGDHELVDEWLREALPGLVERYQQLHANPELSLEEVETAAFVAGALEASGYLVTRGVGGNGVVGVLGNGPGPTLLIRGDMDALPVREQTGLAYASQARARRPDGTQVDVMHACGHDVHTTALVAVARFLADVPSAWAGTLVIVAQPAEELGKGARMMIEDGLFERFPVPDYTLALHVEANLPAGRIGFIPGWAAANVDSVDITIHGRGGHGARPHTTVDPVVTAAHLVTALQTLVSRRVDPVNPAVVTVGSIHGGSKHNVIPDRVELQLTVRSYSDPVRAQLLDGIRQLAEDTCRAFQCPQPPTVAVKDEYTPAMYNDPELVRAAVAIFRSYLSQDDVVELPAAMGGEDFGRYARKLGVPGFLFRLGSVEAGRWEESLRPDGTPLPSLHSSRYAPDPVPTLETGIGAMSRLALALLGRR